MDDREQARGSDKSQGRAGEAPPKGIRAAASLWIAIGGLLLAVNVINGVSNIELITDRPMTGFAEQFMINLVLSLIIGLAFLTVGLQTRNGRAAGIIGNAVGSIFFSHAYLAAALYFLLLSTAVPTGHEAHGILLVLTGINLVVWLVLFAAGVLALLAAREYRIWRTGGLVPAVPASA